MSQSVSQQRRRFLGIAGGILAVSRLGFIGSAQAQAQAQTKAALPAVKAGSHTTIGPVKQINAGVLDTGYVEMGPASGPAVILLHGWPYDVHSYADVAPALAEAGYRVIVPHLRGYGTTRFLASDTMRSGQPVAVAADIIALMDALKIEKAVLGGYDWGARTANIMAVLWPERCKAMVSVSGYLIGSQAAGKMPLPPKAELQWWYQFYFATERGREGYAKNRHDFNKLIWQLASPQWKFDDVTYDRSATAFENPDHVDIVIHNYRWRLGLAEGEAKYDAFEKTLAQAPVIAIPTITMEGDATARRIRSPGPMPRSSPGITSIASCPAASATTWRRKRRRPSRRPSSTSARSRAFSSEVDTGSREENASNKNRERGQGS